MVVKLLIPTEVTKSYFVDYLQFVIRHVTLKTVLMWSSSLMSISTKGTGNHGIGRRWLSKLFGIKMRQTPMSGLGPVAGPSRDGTGSRVGVD